MPDHPGWLSKWDYAQPWYHGSPYEIEVLVAGSTVTQDRQLACIFSHKPQIVCLEDDPVVLARGFPRLRHNGSLTGLLYIINEPIGPQDVYPHPRSTMPPALEWLTYRPLRLRLIEQVSISPAEFLTVEDIDEIMKAAKQSSRNNG